MPGWDQHSDLTPHFDGDWNSKPVQSKGAAYGHWPVSSQLVVCSTKPDICRLSRHWTTMVQRWHFWSFWFVRLFDSSHCLSSWDTPGLILFLYFSLAVGSQLYGLPIPWQFDKSKLVLQSSDETWVTGTVDCQALTQFFNRVCSTFCRST